jgi:hypothetical protein
LLNSHDQEFILDDGDEIQKKLRNLRLRLSLKGKTMVVLQLTEELGLTDSGIEVFEGIDSDKHQAATTRQGIKTMLAVCKSSSGTPT